MATELYRLAASRLTARITEYPGCLVVALAGRADGSARETLAGVTDRALSDLRTRIVFELEAVEEAWGGGADGLARAVRECLRVGRRVIFVRCREELYGQLRAAGLRGVVEHLPSLAAATDGAVQDGVQTIRLHFRHPRSLSMVRRVLRAVTQRAGLLEAAQDDVLMAVVEACTNALLHGATPEGEGETSVCIYLGPASLVVDVADEGPGFDPRRLSAPDLEEPREHGYGLFIIRRVMDRLEVFHGDGGTVVRMTRSLAGAGDAASASLAERERGGAPVALGGTR
jgi:serine/threonine-protein kinase RsbW